jgi:hypothetical protein
VAVIRECEYGVVLEHTVDPAAGRKKPGHIIVGRGQPATLRLEAVVVGYGVALEEVDQVERRRTLLEQHRPYSCGVVIVDANGAEDAAVGLAPAETGIAAVEQIAHKVFLRALHGGSEVASAHQVTLYGLHADGMRVRPAPYGKVDASAVETAVVQGLEECSSVQIVAVHPPDVVVEDSYGTARHHGLRHGTVDDHPPLVLIVPGVPDDAALCGSLSRRYRGRRRRGNTREDRDRVPDCLSPLGQGAKVRGVPLADSCP